MGHLSDELYDMGYNRTEQESPFDENGVLWSNSYETVCDESGIVIRHESSNDYTYRQNYTDSDQVYRYRNTEKVKLPGGYVGSYDWGTDDDMRFSY